MTYADETFYRESYLLGRKPVLPLSDFMFWEKRARAVIDQYTFERITPELREQFTNELGQCACELAEYMYRNEGAEDKQSESVSGMSVTYIQGYERRVCLKHLGVTGLMYRGAIYANT